MANAEVTMVTDSFKLDNDKADRFKKFIEEFGVNLQVSGDGRVSIYYEGSGYIFDGYMFEEGESKITDELIDYLYKNEIDDLIDFIQFHMDDGEQIVLKDICHIRCRSVWGYAAKIDKDFVKEKTLRFE